MHSLLHEQLTVKTREKDMTEHVMREYNAGKSFAAKQKKQVLMQSGPGKKEIKWRHKRSNKYPESLLNISLQLEGKNSQAERKAMEKKKPERMSFGL